MRSKVLAADALLRKRGVAIPVAVVIIVAVLPWLGLSVLNQDEVELIAVYSLVVGGLNLSFGYAGELALGQVAVMAVGAYTTAILNTHGHHDILLALVVASLASAVIGLLTGAPGLRLSTWTLALVSFFLVLLIPNFVEIFPSATGGAIGLAGILRPTLFGVSLGQHGLYVFAVVVAAVWVFAMRNLIRSRYGLALLSLREGPLLARSLGVPVYQLRLSAYLIGGIPAGMAGCLYAYVSGYVSPEPFSFSLSVAVLAAAVVGGAESIYGAPVGAALLVLGPLKTGSFAHYSLLAYGVFLLIMGVLFGGGLAALCRRGLERIRFALSDQGEQRPSTVSRAALPDMAGKELTATDVSIVFGGNKALDGASLHAKPGQVTAILGPNGAGKTTLLNAISGLIKPSSGTITLGDRDLRALRADGVARAGVGRTFQTPMIPGTMSVTEIIESGRLRVRGLGGVGGVFRTPGFRRAHSDDLALSHRVLALAELDWASEQQGRKLPLGTRRLLEALRVVATEPNLILLDEPAAGLDSEALDELASLIRQLRDAGATVLLVEHNVPFVMDLADTVYVMDLGKVVAFGPPAQVRQDPVVIATYLGAKLAERLNTRMSNSVTTNNRPRPQTAGSAGHE